MIAFGVLTIAPSDFWQMNLRELTLAHNGYRRRMEEQWEMIRVQSYYAVVAMQGDKKRKGFDLITLPIDRIKPEELAKRKAGTRKVLSREELVENYKRAGIKMTDTQIDLILENAEKRTNRNR